MGLIRILLYRFEGLVTLYLIKKYSYSLYKFIVSVDSIPEQRSFSFFYFSSILLTVRLFDAQ